MKLRVYHHIILLLSICFFIYLYYETLHHKKNKHSKINRLLNSVEFRLYIITIYFVFLVIFIYETSDINKQNQCHPLFEKCGFDIQNSTIFLSTIVFFIFAKFYDYLLDHDNYIKISDLDKFTLSSIQKN